MLIMGAEAPAICLRDKPDFAHGTSLQRVQSEGKLRVGVNFDLPGFAQIDVNSGSVIGLEADLARRVAQCIFGGPINTINKYVDFVSTPLSERCDHLENEKVDVVFANFAVTKQRAQRVDFSGYYLSSAHTALLCADAPPLHSPADLNKLRVAVVENTTDLETLIPVAPNADVKLYPNAVDCVRAVSDGDVDCFWVTKVAAPGLALFADRPVRTEPFSEGFEQWAAGIQREDRDMAALVRHAVSDSLGNGDLNASFRMSYTTRPH